MKKLFRRKRVAGRTRSSPFLSYQRKKVRSSQTQNRDGITRIRVVGVGGAGCKVVSRMMDGERVKGVEFVAVNTDKQDLDYANAHRKIYIGKALTRGLGAGMNPDIGRQAAEENRSEIGEALDGSDVVFVTCGMGGGTGTGAGPIVAEIARERGVLTIGIVTKPFTFEGAQRMTIAQEGLNRIKDKVDALVVVPNDRIFSVISKDTPIIKAFSYVDDVLKHGVQAIAELVNVPGIVNVDFADIRTVMKDAGTTLIGIGVAAGQERSIKAVNMAINSPLLEFSMEGARGVLFGVAGGRDLKMSEISDVAKVVAQNLDPQAKIIFGAYHDRRLKDKSIKVTVIATGFSGMLSRHHAMSIPSFFMEDKTAPEEETKASQNVKNAVKNELTKPRLVVNDDEDRSMKREEDNKSDSWEIPAFLRRKKNNR